MKTALYMQAEARHLHVFVRCVPCGPSRAFFTRASEPDFVTMLYRVSATTTCMARNFDRRNTRYDMEIMPRVVIL